MSERKQICVVGGGMAFASDADFRRWLAELEISYDRLFYGTDWKPWLAEKLVDCDVSQPQMPNRQNARYSDWSVYFSKVLEFLAPSAVLIGHSLGGIFLAKYFSENPPIKKFAKIILIAAPYDDESSESLGDFRVSSARNLVSVADEIHLIHSKDDPVVAFSELAKYQRDLPIAKPHIFDDRGHFNLSEFPELLGII